MWRFFKIGEIAVCRWCPLGRGMMRRWPCVASVMTMLGGLQNAAVAYVGAYGGVELWRVEVAGTCPRPTFVADGVRWKPTADIQRREHRREEPAPVAEGGECHQRARYVELKEARHPRRRDRLRCG